MFQLSPARRLIRRTRSGTRVAQRRLVVAAVAVLLGAPSLGAVPAAATGAAAQPRTQPNPSSDLNLPVEMLPPDLGQSAERFVVPGTGHTVGGQMLDYWRANGAAAVYGDPISEPFAFGGYYSQAFERGILQFRPEFIYTEDPTVRLAPIGTEALSARTGGFRADGRRATGGGDRRAAAWVAPGPGSDVAVVDAAAGSAIDPTTGHPVGGAAGAWYAAHEGDFYLGSALSRPIVERGVTAQYFEGGLLLTGRRGTRLAPLPREMATTLEIPTAPVDEDGLVAFTESRFWDAANPSPVGDQEAPGRKRIEVSIGQQTLRAFQGDELILETLVSTGIVPNETERGRFHVRIKRETETMAGFTDGTGEVVALDDGTQDGTTPPAGARYEVEDVPDVLYFNAEAEALHGAYWHDNFGVPMSHGCVNLPLDVASFLFGWAPLGTEISVFD